MRKWLPGLLIAAALAVFLTSCGMEASVTVSVSPEETTTVKTTAAETTTVETAAVEMTAVETEVALADAASGVKLTIGDKSYSATLYDTGAAKAFSEMLPLTLEMSELNGNEKYYYLDLSLPAAGSCPQMINAGELMLYGSNCLVLFYADFPTSYSYTPVGNIDDPAGLAEALGSGSATVVFETNS